MKKSVYIILVLCLLLAFSTQALTFETEIQNVKASIDLEDTALYKLKIRNDLATIENFLVYTTSVEWSLNSIPASDRNPKVYPESFKLIELELKPTAYISPGAYSVPISVKNADTGEIRIVAAPVVIYSKDTPQGKYLPGIRSVTQIASEVDPREDVSIKVDLFNQNPLNITQITISLRSNLINKEYQTSLNPLETKTINFNIELNPLVEPQEDILYTTIKVNQFTFEPEPSVYKIITYGDLKTIRDVKRGFLKTTQDITIENQGNEFKKGTFRESRNIFSSIFTTTNPKGEKVIFDEEKNFAWEVALDPGTSTKIIVTNNYQYLFIAIVLVILIIAGYFMFRPSIMIKKSAIVIGRKHGGISDLSVRMAVVNRGKANVKDIVLTDKLPNLVDLYKDFEEGTLRPSSILKHEKKGTIMKWQIRTLEPGEERIIHYKVKTRLSILGSLSLPVTVAKFKQGNSERSRVVGSNRLLVRA